MTDADSTALERDRAEALSRAVAPLEDELITPALVIDLDAVEHNIAAMVQRAGSPQRWRPHLKTTKQAVVISALIRAGLRHLKVATLDELELVLRTGAAEDVALDVLVAYPLQRAACRGALALAARWPEAQIHVLADSPAHLEALAAWSGSDPLSVLLDVDLGMGRTGSAPDRWRALEATPEGLSLAGLHGYDGHHRWTHREAAHAGYGQLCALAQAFLERPALRIQGAFELLTSGTHSYAHALAYPGFAESKEAPSPNPWLHRVSPGTIVFNDRRSKPAAEDLGLRQAAFVASRVISVGPGRATLDAGSKGVTPDADSRGSCAVLGHPALSPRRASEEHLPLALPEPSLESSLEFGALAWLVPDHVCTTVNLHREALWIRGDRLVGRGPIVSGHRPRAPLTEAQEARP
ncbi:amino acid aldolase or racemase-like protein [Plesiocystis pacifica SIR-1]|uniref:Amino acid aldolase or racemase-like protein n=1 Tax=Plesiocystis pacifica SIR-1 TaxID=391625 RepID=A6GF07_9BACT|nr:alanine racemase [Plesiocystis pacifica]EDM75534.1 amino acid aldolase or racemase-like protein [Plesiocystis pacifica SIR-1]